MRKFFDPMPAGGAPIYTQELNDALSKQMYLTIESLMNALTDVISGIIVSGGSITDAGGGTYNIGAGIAFFVSGTGGEFREFPAATGLTLPFYINQVADVVEQIEFADAATKDFIVVKNAIVEQTASGSTIAISDPEADHLYVETFIINSFELTTVKDSINSVASDLASHEAETSAAHNDSGKPAFIAHVNSAGILVAQYKKSGEPTWTVTRLGLGNYSILRNGLALGSNAATLLTTNNDWTTANMNLSAIRIYNTDTNAAEDSGFKIAVYLLPE